MRADRLLSILLFLQNKGKQTAKELAQKLEVSERTILRDMEDLSSAGIPVYAERGSSGGWKLSEGYRTTLTGLKGEEIQALLLNHSSTLLQDLGITNNLEAAFQKLLAATPTTLQKDIELVRARIHVDGAGWFQSKESITYLSVVQEAVWEEKKLLIEYQKGQGQESRKRVVQPLGLVAMRSIWYMVARVDTEEAELESGHKESELDDTLRSYRISRIIHAEKLDENFQRPVSFNLEEYWEVSTKQFKAAIPRYPARVVMNKKLLNRLQKKVFVEVLGYTETEDDQWIEAELLFNTLDSACEIILGHGQLIKVIAPDELKQAVISEAEKLLELYGYKNKRG
ncbi:helix-turn-helix transcriptional regulator [Bacillus horti]|uniref:DNA-binding transcriptional regulator YafY n=1 Tax=Caldalkalibacillus horti TaxID=77523 RepID=A0ABT9VY34_9BACI|nr:YafY family protein [Bacillus horti]MDQ0165908.1 putative DNA-binding transcriptional regulator YafY [Bacillus horti]